MTEIFLKKCVSQTFLILNKYLEPQFLKLARYLMISLLSDIHHASMDHPKLTGVVLSPSFSTHDQNYLFRALCASSFPTEFHHLDIFGSPVFWMLPKSIPQTLTATSKVKS